MIRLQVNFTFKHQRSSWSAPLLLRTPWAELMSLQHLIERSDITMPKSKEISLEHRRECLFEMGRLNFLFQVFLCVCGSTAKYKDAKSVKNKPAHAGASFLILWRVKWWETSRGIHRGMLLNWLLLYWIFHDGLFTHQHIKANLKFHHLNIPVPSGTSSWRGLWWNPMPVWIQILPKCFEGPSNQSSGVVCLEPRSQSYYISWKCVFRNHEI